MPQFGYGLISGNTTSKQLHFLFPTTYCSTNSDPIINTNDTSSNSSIHILYLFFQLFFLRTKSFFLLLIGIFRDWCNSFFCLFSERVPNCQKCGQHGRKSRLKGHKRVCPYKECSCAKVIFVVIFVTVLIRFFFVFSVVNSLTNQIFLLFYFAYCFKLNKKQNHLCHCFSVLFPILFCHKKFQKFFFNIKRLLVV